MRRLVLFVAVIAATASGCGGSDDRSSTGEPVATTTTASTVAETTPPPPQSTTTTEATSASDRFLAFIRTQPGSEGKTDEQLIHSALEVCDQVKHAANGQSYFNPSRKVLLDFIANRSGALEHIGTTVSILCPSNEDEFQALVRDAQPATTTTTTGSGGPSVRSEPPGLFCRDLAARGYSYADSIVYWDQEGQPDRMDADLNGRPCETVYPASEVQEFWG